MRYPLLMVAVAALVAPLPAQLSGTYTINPGQPASATNFTSLNAASLALGTQGVSGPVTFDIFGSPRTPYTESAQWIAGISLGANTAVWVLASWPGTSATNTVTFQAGPGQHPVIDAAGKDVAIYWNGADDTTIRGLEIRGATFDAVCMYTPSGDPAGTLPGTGTAVRNTIDRCHIHSCGAVGVLVYANSGTLTDTVISNNVFHDLVTSTNRGGFSGFVRDGYIAGRRDSNTQILQNSFLVNTLAGTSNTLAAIIERHDGAANRTGITRIEGNAFHKTTSNGLNYLFYAATGAPTPFFDVNCYFDPSGSFTFADLFGTIYADPAVWIATAGVDGNSIPIDPQFVSLANPTDLHIRSTSPIRDAIPAVAGVARDVDGELRSNPVSIGADEGCPAPLFELNDPAADLTVDGVRGHACQPTISGMFPGTPASLEVRSTNVGLAWEVGISFAPLVSANSGAFITNGGQIVNLSLASPIIYLFGGAAPSPTAGFPGVVTFAFNTPPGPAILSAQALHFDPTNPDGFAVSQGAQIVVP